MEKVQRRSEKSDQWLGMVYRQDRQKNLGLFSFMSEGGYERGLKNIWHGQGLTIVLTSVELKASNETGRFKPTENSSS